MKKINRFETYALVTGAASGMGRIYALRLAEKGYNVVLVDINEKGLNETEQMVKAQIASSSEIASDLKEKFNVIVVPQDLSAIDAADKVYERTEADGCQVEVLVNNAGIMYCQGIAETSERMLRLIMMVHMNTPLMLCPAKTSTQKEAHLAVRLF